MTKIVYIVRKKLHYYPPCVAQIRYLKRLKVDVEVLYGTCNESALNIFDKEKIKYKKMANIGDENKNFIDKLKNLITFRLAVNKEMKKYGDDTIFWFGNAESMFPLLGTLRKKKYIISVLELYDDKEQKYKRRVLNKVIRGAICTTACEETRAYIMQYWYKLKKLPYLFPNKPYEHSRNRRMEPSSILTKEIIEKIKDKNVIIYQGILQNTEELVQFAKALNKTKKEYTFLLLGIDEFNSFEIVKKYYKNSLYFSYVPAPLHLEVTSYARIGICFYRPIYLNYVFCAPNKIYEYTGYSIPVICNKIPGLENTIGRYGAGECINLSENEIADAINKIDDNYEKYQTGCNTFFEACDNEKTMKQLLKDNKII